MKFNIISQYTIRIRPLFLPKLFMSKDIVYIVFDSCKDEDALGPAYNELYSL